MQRRSKTYEAVYKQVNAMGCEFFEIGLRNASEKLMQNIIMDKSKLFSSIGFLAKRNVNGEDIYIRPAPKEKHGLILVDDAKTEALIRMRQDGLNPAVTVETSPNNYQVWLKLGDDLEPSLRTKIAKFLATRYNTDKASADYRHYGRLAGFTNRKPDHTNNGLQPWVLCHDASGAYAVNRESLIHQVKVIEEQVKQESLRVIRDPQDTADTALQYKPAIKPKYKPNYHYQLDNSKRDVYQDAIRFYDNACRKYGESQKSERDFSVAVCLAKMGYSESEIYDALASVIPDLSRKSDPKYYLNLTVRNAMNKHF